MPCKTCKTANGLAVCLFCGHSFCGSHRSERDGAAACTACQEAEHARASGRKPSPAGPAAREAAAPRREVQPISTTAAASAVVIGGPALSVPVSTVTVGLASKLGRALGIVLIGSVLSAAAADFTPSLDPEVRKGVQAVGILFFMVVGVGSLLTGGGPVAPGPVSAARDAASPPGIGTPVSDLEGAVTATLKPLELIPEAGWTPVIAGIAVGAPTGAYLWFFLGWLLAGTDGIAIARPALTAVGAAFAFAGVWIISKSRLS